MQPARDFAAQLFRALAGSDDDLLERSAQDLEGAWRRLSEEYQDLEESRRLETPPSPAFTDDGMVVCANCEARVPKGFAFCGKCGVPLKKDSCSACGDALVEGFQFCGKCGARLE
jgi:hypothetical protein